MPRETLSIRRATPADSETLLGVWLSSVRATHDFVAPTEIDAMIPHVRDYLASRSSDIWLLYHESGSAVGFMGMSGNKMESLFLAPEFHRMGGGTMLVHHARSLHAELTVDVNEENEAARAFYERCGFVVEGRSELDEQGRPHPILHMRLSPAS